MTLTDDEQADLRHAHDTGGDSELLAQAWDEGWRANLNGNLWNPYGHRYAPDRTAHDWKCPTCFDGLPCENKRLDALDGPA